MGSQSHGVVYKVDFDENMAKICWMFTSGPWKGQHGYTVVMDNGEGSNADEPDANAGILWTDGSDIVGVGTIVELDAMTVDDYLTWLMDDLFPFLQIPPGTPVWAPFTQGNVQVR